MKRNSTTLIIAVGLALTSFFTSKASAQQVDRSPRKCPDSGYAGFVTATDSTFSDAKALKAILTRHGFGVRCIWHSTMERLFERLGTRREAVFVTSRGDFEVYFFQAPDGAERVKVTEEPVGRMWRYTFGRNSQGDPSVTSVTMEGNRTYFVQVHRWLIMVDNPDLAAALRQLLLSV
jgi:hypothetical protein